MSYNKERLSELQPVVWDCCSIDQRSQLVLVLVEKNTTEMTISTLNNLLCLN